MHRFVFEWDIEAEYYEGQLKGYLNNRNDFVDMHYTEPESQSYILDFLSDHLTVIEKSIRRSKHLDLMEQSLNWKTTFILKDGKLYLVLKLKASKELSTFRSFIDNLESDLLDLDLLLESSFYLYLINSESNQTISTQLFETYELIDAEIQSMLE